MKRGVRARKGERGSALVEFAIGAAVFLTATFGVLEFSRLLWTHNALSDAARRGARYAVNHQLPADEAAVKNVAVYGNAEGTGNPLVTGLDPARNITVTYTNSPVTGVFGYPDGTVTVGITNYEFRFVVPFVTRTLTMPAYSTTLTAESAGMIPADVTPSPTPGGGTPTPTPTPGGGTPTPTPPPPTPTPTPPPPTPTPTPPPPPTPTPTPVPTPTPAPTPTPTPPPTCKKNQSISTGCVCKAPMRVVGDKCK